MVQFKHGSDHAPVAARLELNLLKPANNQHAYPMYAKRERNRGLGCVVQ